MSDTDSFSADPRELAARVLLSQERLRNSYRGTMTGGTPTRVYRVWSACVALTAGWGKTADAVYVKRIEEQAGLAKGKASAILRDLHQRDVIVWQKDPGQRSIGRLELPALATVDPWQCSECGAREWWSTEDHRCGKCGSKVPPRGVQDRQVAPDHDRLATEALRHFGEAPSAAQTDRDPRRG